MRKFIILFILPFFYQVEVKALEYFFEGEYGTISGEEFWVFDDNLEGNPYSRHDIIWRFSAAPLAAQECAKKGHAQLKLWLENKNSIVSKYLKLIGDLGGVTNFFMWTNDYQTNNAVKKGINPRPAKVWNWQDMFLKYESTVLPDGTCIIPNEKEVAESLDQIANYFEMQREQNLNFVQRVFDGNRKEQFQKTLKEIQQTPLSSLVDSNPQ